MPSGKATDMHGVELHHQVFHEIKGRRPVNPGIAHRYGDQTAMDPGRQHSGAALWSVAPVPARAVPCPGTFEPSGRRRGRHHPERLGTCPPHARVRRSEAPRVHPCARRSSARDRAARSGSEQRLPPSPGEPCESDDGRQSPPQSLATSVLRGRSTSLPDTVAEGPASRSRTVRKQEAADRVGIDGCTPFTRRTSPRLVASQAAGCEPRPCIGWSITLLPELLTPQEALRECSPTARLSRNTAAAHSCSTLSPTSRAQTSTCSTRQCVHNGTYAAKARQASPRSIKHGPSATPVHR